MDSGLTVIGDLDLRGGAPQRIATHAGLVLRVVAGTVWLTAEGRAQDMFLDAGAALPLDVAANLVIEGVGPARVQIAPVRAVPDRVATRGLPLVDRARRAIGRFCSRAHFGASLALPAD